MTPPPMRSARGSQSTSMNRLCLVWLGLLLLAPVARAEGPGSEAPVAADPISYALIVGSNAGGPGQEALRYAEVDAQRISEVLITLGGYEAEHVTRLLQPSGAELFGALEQLEVALAQHAQAGEVTRF